MFEFGFKLLFKVWKHFSYSSVKAIVNNWRHKLYLFDFNYACDIHNPRHLHALAEN